MTTRPDPDVVIAAWLLDEAPDRAPERLLTASRDRIQSTHQRRSKWPAWRVERMNSTLKLALGAAAVVAVVVAGIAFLPRSDPSVGGPGDVPTASPAPTPAPTPTPTAAASAAVPEFPGVSDDVAPGTYRWLAGGATPADITFTIPAGWMSRYGIPHKDRGGPGEIAFGNWLIANVYADSCQWQGSLLDPSVGPTVDDLATALVAQKGRNATAPVDVTLGGHAAKRVELSIPADLDRATCDGGVIRTWVAPGGDTALDNETENLGMHPGQLNVVYIVDVDGERLVIDTWHMPGTSAADLAELDAILVSMRIGS
jgi:hypothetical protein